MYENEFGLNNGMDTNKNSDYSEQNVNTERTSMENTVSAIHDEVTTAENIATPVQAGTDTVSPIHTGTDTVSPVHTGTDTSSTVTDNGFTMSTPRYSDHTSHMSASNTSGSGYYSSGGTGFSGYANSGAGSYAGAGRTGYGSSTGSTYSSGLSGRYTDSTASSGYGSSSATSYGSNANTYGSRTSSETGYTGSTYSGTSGTYGTGSRDTNSYNTSSNAYTNIPNPGYSRYTGGNNTNRPPKEKKKKSGKAVLALAMVAVLLVGAIGGGAASYYYLDKRIDSVAESVDKQAKNSKIVEVPDKIELNKSDKRDDVKANSADSVTEAVASDGKMTTEQVVANGLSSVVAITNYGVTEIRTMWGNFKQDSESAGSGVVIGQTDDELLILTNYHVVEGSKSLSVVFSWEENEEDIDDADIVNAGIKDYDEERDIAVIAIPIEELSKNALSQVTVAPIGSSDDLNLGEQVVVIGNALGYGQSVTTGIVSALNRKIGSTDYYGNTDDNIYIQTDAAINPGNSGGAMFNMYGELVGINSAKIGGTQVDSVGYAIPISDVTAEIESMMNQETRETVALDQRGYLGVSIVDVTEEVSETYGYPIGVYVAAVEEGYGADKAGIKKEDIITAINGKTLTTSEELKEYLSKYSVGEEVTVTVSRDDGNGYESKDIEVTLTENPSAFKN